MMNRDEDAVLAAVRAGDPDAFGRLIEYHRRGLTLYCYLMLGDQAAARHAIAETVLTAWLEVHVLESLATSRRWLYGIATRVCLEAIDEAAMRCRRPVGTRTGLRRARRPGA